MALIAWRKWQAGLRGQGDTKDMQAVVEHVSNQAGSSSIVTDQSGIFDTIVANRVIVKKRLKIPSGTDMFD